MHFLKKPIKLLIIVCLLNIQPVGSQTFAVELPRMNVVYLGVDNPIKIVVNDLPDSCVIVEASFGKIQKGKNAFYSWNGVANEDSLCLILFDTCHQQMIAKRDYRVFKIPVILSLGGTPRYSKNSEIRLPEFRAMAGVAALISGFDICGSCQMHRYRTTVFSKTLKEPWIAINDGPRFGSAVSERFKSLKAGDWVRFDRFVYQCPGDINLQYPAEELLFKIK